MIKRSKNAAIELGDSEYSIPAKLIYEMKVDFLKGIPFSYLLEMSEFYENQFFINPHVLIPRPETEQLVDIIVTEQKRTFNRVLDVGIGSGVIILSLLAKDIAKYGVGVDISAPAIEVAVINARRLRLLERVSFLTSDRLFSVTGEFDLIVSNPPYIRAIAHGDLVHQQVAAHEPHLALFLEDSAYEEWFTVFFKQIYSHLSAGGFFYMEGHELEVAHQAELLEKIGFSQIRVINDLLGAPRFLSAQKK